MSRGGSFGGGQSSLGYLFGSGSEAAAVSAPASPPTVQPPPYGIESDASTTDTVAKRSSPKSSSTPDAKHSPSNNNYQRSQGQNFGNFITDRPSTKVTSAPGGDSSIGYLFEDK